jgi:hypothetical protein
VQTSQGKPYLGYFHLTQVRQLSNNELNNNDSMDCGGNTHTHTHHNNNGGNKNKRGMEESEAPIPQRMRCAMQHPFSDMTNH